MLLVVVDVAILQAYVRFLKVHSSINNLFTCAKITVGEHNDTVILTVFNTF